jgi:hypothetical protein
MCNTLDRRKLSSTIDEWSKRFEGLLKEFDEVAILTLKGHLLIEEQLNAILSKFVVHPDLLDHARLRFVQKVELARSCSLGERDNTMWDLVLAINVVRNELAHSLHSDKRELKLARLRDKYVDQVGELRDLERESDVAMLAGALATCVGFLSGFNDEAIRFRSLVDALDRTVNAHRHVGEGTQRDSV